MGGIGSGRPRRPTEIAELNGAEARHINDRAPDMEKATEYIQAPEHLDSVARDVWNYYVPGLTRSGVLALADVDTLALFCEAVSTAREASFNLSVEGKVVDTYGASGKFAKTQKNPWWVIWKEATAEVMRIGARFGLTPADRARIVVPEEPTAGNADPGRYLN